MGVDGPSVPSPHYFQAKRLNSWVLALAPTLLHAVRTATMDLRYARDADPGTVLATRDGLPALLRNISRGSWTIGFFELPPSSVADGSPIVPTTALMIVNYEHAYCNLQRM